MSPLEGLIRARIAAGGPIGVAEYMEMALGHPEYGYYMKDDPFGVSGDFITAPEISQVFGELIGLWAAVTWQQIGRPENVVVVECGPGRGTLMSDFLRTVKSIPEFLATIDIHLVETSRVLRERQKSALAGFSPHWHDRLDTVPEGPMILISNEFLDALPIRQLVRTETGWAERRIGVDDSGLQFEIGEIAPDADHLVPPVAFATPGDIFEICPGACEVADILNRRLSRAPGAALFIDYGHDSSSFGDTLQAVRSHKYASVLSDPGNADITAHVDFDSFGQVLRRGGSRTMGPITQSVFLTALGIVERTEKLAHGTAPETAAILRSGTRRLTAPDGMGNLFKVMVATHADCPTLAGFETGIVVAC